MAIIDRITLGFHRFTANQKGATAITFALSIVPLMLASGAAIDYLRYTDAQTRLQAALDSGALAVAVSGSLTAAERIKAGEDTFKANLKSAQFDFDQVEAAFTLEGATVKAYADLALPSGLMQIAGLQEMAVAVETEISVPDSKTAEIALVLDYSGSMTEKSGGQVKYVAMRNAAIKLLNDLEAASPNKIKAGLVPFSHHVYVTLPKTFVVGATGKGTWTGCTQDRRYPHNLTDETPIKDNSSTKWGQPIAKEHASDGCAAYAPNQLTVAPLTDDFDALRGQLKAMRPYAWTHIALGAEFGYHLLSPNEPFDQGAEYDDNKVSKVMVILTDGRQTEPAFGDGTRSDRQGEKNLEVICQNAKESGITVITVAFDLQHEATRTRLSDCSTDPAKHFFVAEDSAELAQAFEDIKKQVSAQIFISK